MKRSRFALRCLTSLLIAGAVVGCSSEKKGDKTYKYERRANFKQSSPLVKSVIRDMLKRELLDYGLELVDYSIVDDPKKAGLIEIELTSFYLPKVPQARRMIVDFVETFMERMNNNIELIPTFAPTGAIFPEVLHVDIELDHFYGSWANLDYVQRIVMNKQVISYYDYAGSLLHEESLAKAQYMVTNAILIEEGEQHRIRDWKIQKERTIGGQEDLTVPEEIRELQRRTSDFPKKELEGMPIDQKNLQPSTSPIPIP